MSTHIDLSDRKILLGKVLLVLAPVPG